MLIKYLVDFIGIIIERDYSYANNKKLAIRNEECSKNDDDN